MRILCNTYFWELRYKLIIFYIIYFIKGKLKVLFYNRETIAVFNYEMQKIPFIRPCLLCTQKINPLFNLMFSANHDKVDRLSANGETL